MILDTIVDFKDIEVGIKFSIPSIVVDGEHEMECFIKLRHNKAKSLEDNRICHFVDRASCWLFAE